MGASAPEGCGDGGRRGRASSECWGHIRNPELQLDIGHLQLLSWFAQTSLGDLEKVT